MKVDGNEIGTWDGIITIFSGYDDNAKIKRFILTANGDENAKLPFEEWDKMTFIFQLRAGA